jgi:cytochrome c oxidase assembly protein subunit 15
MIAALGLQGTLGYIQYFTHLPAGLVWIHVTGSVLVWIAVLRLFFALRDRGPLIPATAEPAAAEPAAGLPTGQMADLPPRQPEPLDR